MTCNTCQHEASWHPVATDTSLYFFYGMIQALVAQRNKHLNVSGDYVEIWCVTSIANHMPCTHQRQNKVLSTIASYLIFWKFIIATKEGQVLEALYRLYFGNTANNALNIYGTDACFKVRMNHCVKSIPWKKEWCVLWLQTETSPSQHTKWSCNYISWGLGQEPSPHHKRPVCYKMLYKALDFDNLGKR